MILRFLVPQSGFTWLLIGGSLAIALIQLSEYWIGLTLGTSDTAHHSQLLVTQYFRNFSLWYDRCVNGLSVLSNPSYQLFYPLQYLYAVLPSHVAERILCIIHYPLFALGLWRWAKQLGAKDGIAVAVIFLLIASGLTSSTIARSSIYFYSFVWMPIAISFAIDAWRRNSILSAGAAGASFASIMMSGDVFMMGFSFIILAAVILAEHLTGGRASKAGEIRWPRIGILGATFCLALLAVGGFLLVHAQQMFVLSARATGFTTHHVQLFSFHPLRIGAFFVDLFGEIGTSEFKGGAYMNSLNGGPEWWFRSIYFGPFALILLLIVPRALSRRRFLWPYALVALGFFLAAFGKYNPVESWILDQVASVRVFRYPEKLLVPVVLSAFPIFLGAADDLLSTVRQRLARAVSPFVLYGLAAVLFLGPVLLHRTGATYYDPNSLMTPEVLQRISNVDVKQRRFVGAEAEETKVPNKGLATLLEFGPAFWGERQYACSESTLNPLEYNVYGDLFASREARENFGITHMAWNIKDSSPISDSIKTGDLRVLAQDSDNHVAIVADPVPIARAGLLTGWQIRSPLAAAARSASGEALALSVRNGRAMLNPDFALDAQGLVSKGTALPRAWVPMNLLGEECSSSFTGEFVVPMGVSRFDVNADCPTILYVNARFVGGWRAEVDGKPTWIGRVNDLMLGIPVPAGAHAVSLRFDPPFVRGFVEVSLAVQTMLLLYFLFVSWSGGSMPIFSRP